MQDCGCPSSGSRHSALHCREMGTAVADMIADDPTADAIARHGLARFEWPTNRGE